MTIHFRPFFLLSFLVGGLFLSSCDPRRVYEDNTNIPDYVWDMDHPVRFEVQIDDTTVPHNIYVNVRHTDSYKYSNIYLFIKTYFPNGKFAYDTLNCPLANEEGRWMGDGLGDIWDNQILFKEHKRFPLAGKYTFELRHAMRDEKLPDIMDVGLRIERAK